MRTSIAKKEKVEKIGGEVGNGMEVGFEKNPTPFQSISPLRLAQ